MTSGKHDCPEDNSADGWTSTASIAALFDLWFKHVPEEPVENTKRDVARILSCCTLCRCGRVLDLGCGTGRHLREFAAQGFSHLVGVDASHAAIQKASRLSKGLPQISYVCDLFEKFLTNHDGSYDLVMSMDMTFSLYPKESVQHLLDLLSGVLNSQGVAVIEIWNAPIASADKRFAGATQVYQIPSGEFHYQASLSEDRSRIVFTHKLIRCDGTAVEFPAQVQYIYSAETLDGLARKAGLIPEPVCFDENSLSAMLLMRKNRAG